MRTRSENHFRRGNPRVHAMQAKALREKVTAILDREIEHPVLDRITVGLCRVSAGTLDDDNLRGALKHVRDAVARWLGLDDADARIAFQYEQREGKRGDPRLRITVDDHQGGDDIERVIEGTVPKRGKAKPVHGAGAARKRVSTAVGKKAWATTS